MKKKPLEKKNAPFTAKSDNHPTISVCIIAKNEEKHLDRCLRSVKPVAHEIIIVDTGSTDKTLKIARKYTDKVWIHPWNDSFSEARNHALGYATGDWIFTIDADEELVKEDIPILHQAVRDNNIDAVLIQLITTSDRASGKGVFNQERLLRNNGVIRYQGRVHNRIIGITSSKVYPIRLLHYGYHPGQSDMAKKFDRTVPLLLKDLAD
jgi:glycosyltransferase involved in cell wall biosynthesis